MTDGKRLAPTTFHEFYGRGAIGQTAANTSQGLNVVGLRVLDLRFQNPLGQPWDLSDPTQQEMALAVASQDDPDWIVGAPPCTDWGILNWNVNVAKMDKTDVKKRIAIALAHLSFVCKPYDRQIKRGKYFLHEHPHDGPRLETNMHQ